MKRRYPLMINESPAKKVMANKESTNTEGPTIHELDNAEVLPEELFGEEAEALVQVNDEFWSLYEKAYNVYTFIVEIYVIVCVTCLFS